VIFDLDGVVVDSEIWWDEVRRDVARAHGRDWTIDDRHAVMGAHFRQLLGHAGALEETERRGGMELNKHRVIW
jgi:beta-phosphoglucomutase-like phosphatase (HAD superfamily)